MLNNLQYSLFEVKYISYTPSTTDCIKCGTSCKLNSKGKRNSIDINIDHPILLHTIVGVYYCPHCHYYFRIQPPWISKGSRYTIRAKDKATKSVSEDQMPFTNVPHRLLRDFYISPVKSSIWNWFYFEASQLNFNQDYLPYVKASFSGVLCTDELYDDKFCIVFSSDPVSDNVVYFELFENSISKDQMEDYLNNLKSLGIIPNLNISDGSKIYPDAFKSIFPNSKHLLCLFHFVRNFCNNVVKAVSYYGKHLPKEKPLLDSIPTSTTPKLSTTTGLSDKQIISRNRFLFTTRPSNLSTENDKLLSQLLNEHPKLQIYRDFMSDFFNIFDQPDKLFANQKRSQIINNHSYIQDKSLSKSIKSLSNYKNFSKVTLFYDYPDIASTNNHVEGINRNFRKRQNSHYRIRTKKTITSMITHELFRKLRFKKYNSNFKYINCSSIS